MATLIAVSKAVAETGAAKVITFHGRVALAQEFAGDPPRSASSNSMAWSRRPTDVWRSHAWSRRSTSSELRYFGIVASRQFATRGTQAARSRSIAPRCNKKPKSERKAVTMSFARPGLIECAWRTHDVEVALQDGQIVERIHSRRDRRLADKPDEQPRLALHVEFGCHG